MKHASLSALIVATLIVFDVSYTIAKADTKVTIFKVAKVSQQGELMMRAWPSPKSRIVKKLPYNAKDLTEAGKERIISGSKWIQVNWKDNQGWVNAYYLEKTGVLLHANKIASRNANATVGASPSISETPKVDVGSLNDRPQELEEGDRYDQTLEETVATPEKVSYSESVARTNNQKLLSCNGEKPSYWNIKLDISGKNMQIKFPQTAGYNVPIKYHAWESPSKLKMNIGGSKGRNIVDVNLEKNNACLNRTSHGASAYQVNATINNQYYSGCCSTVNY